MALSIEVSDLSFSFGGHVDCLHDASLEVAESELCCLLGPNGAGKTTLLRCILGLVRPSTGSLRVLGQDTAKLSPRHLARLIAYVPQSFTTTFPFTALEIVMMGRTPYLGLLAAPSRADRQASLACLEQMGAAYLAGRAFTTLSGGERQITMLARALVQEAQVLVLDEPTAALDYGNEVALLQLVSDLTSRGSTVLMTTHQPNHALVWADRAVLMADGSVVMSGPVNEVVTAERLSDLYHTPLRVASLPALVGDGPEQLVCLPEVNARRRDGRPGGTRPERSSEPTTR